MRALANSSLKHRVLEGTLLIGHFAVCLTALFLVVRRAQIIVRRYCEELSVAHLETGLITSYRQALRSLHQAGAPLRLTEAAPPDPQQPPVGALASVTARAAAGAAGPSKSPAPPRTPVSGRASSTWSGASRSPARAASTELR